MGHGLVRRAIATAIVLTVCMDISPTHATGQPGLAEHRYRISGKVRLLLFWIGADDVGGARASWRNDAIEGEEFSLLIGSDPQRAPRGVNEWGYVREQVQGGTARVFGVRTASDADSPDSARAAIDDRTRAVSFDALCSEVKPNEMTTAVATVSGPADLSYARFDPLFDALIAHRRWSLRRLARPPGTAPGFLTAFSRLMKTMAVSQREGSPSAAPHALYVYKDSVYDLTVDRVESLTEVHTKAGRVRNVVRAEFKTRHIRLNSTTRFDATFGVEEPLAGVPIQVTYQPNWWFKIRLELDDELAVPSAGDDAALRRRVDDTCASAAAAARP